MVEEKESDRKFVGGTGITAGGNVTFGDVSGQVFIGENIIQIINRDGKKSWLYTNGFRPSTDPNNIFGRQEELEKIDEFFKQNSALAITGFRGTGKSTLASMYTNRVQKKGDFAGIYWRTVDDSIDISDVVGNFFTIIGKPIKELGYYKIGNQIDLLFRELNAAPYFLVLDNFEILLDPQTNKPIKPGFSDIIEKANESAGRSRILFTSWESPASERGIRPEYYHIGGLEESAGLQLLKRKGISGQDEELKKAVELSGGHPLALILLVQLIKGGTETLSTILTDNTLWLGEKGEVAERILDKVYKERIDEVERKLLKYTSLYREPVPSKAIVVAANDPSWTEAITKKIALNLLRKSLLQKFGENYWEEALVHNYAYIKLVDKIKHHKFAYKYYVSIPLSEKCTKKEDVKSLIEAHFHACKAKEYDMAANIIFDHKLNHKLHWWGNYSALIDLYQRILPKDPLHNDSLLSDLRTHCNVLGSLASVYNTVGEVRKAIEHYEKALEISSIIRDRQSISVWFGGLGNAHYNLGEIKKAIMYYEKALKIAEDNGNRRNQGAFLGGLGNAYRALGEVEKAIDYYEKALEVAQEIGDRKNEGAWVGSLGIAYRTMGEIRKAIEYYEKSLKIALEIGDRASEDADLGNIGVAYSDLGENIKAIEYYQKALKVAQEIGDKKSESGKLGNIGSAYMDLGEKKKAIEFHDKALKIAQEIRDRKSEGTELGNLGSVYRSMGEEKTAIEYHKKALKIAQEIGDKKSEHVWLGNLGIAYRYMGEVKTAIEYHKKALKITQEIRDRAGERTAFGDLGISYYIMGEVKTAIEYHKKSLKIAQEIKDGEGQGIELENLGKAYLHQGEEKKAIECYEKGLKIAQEIEDIEGEGLCLFNLGSSYHSLGEEKKAIEYYEKALKIVQNVSDKGYEIELLGSLGVSYNSLGEVKTAIEYYKKALKIAQDIGDKESEGVWLSNLGAAFKDMKKYKEAVASYILAKDIFIKIENKQLDTTESNLKNIEEEVGEKEFERIKAEVAPLAVDIVRKTLEETPA